MNIGSRGGVPAALRQAASVTVLAAALAGCATLPTNGPTNRQILHDSVEMNQIGFQLVDIDTANIAQLASPRDSVASLASLAANGAVDTLGPGDVLSIQIYEVGASLFGSGRTAIGGSGGTGEGAVLPIPSASAESIGDGVVVDRNGQITVPYAGTINVVGLTPRQVQDRILAGLRGKSQSPQVIVSLRHNVSSTVVVMGAVARPGRIPLTLAREHLLDAIAESGGIALNVQSGNSTASGTGPQDMLLRFTRGERTMEVPLESIRSGSPDDLLLLPGDRIEVIRRPRTFTVFGAIDRISQVPFESSTLTLAEALARAGGPSDARADARAVYVFRLPPAAPDTPQQPPVAYRINMLRAQNYFLAQRFAMRDKDVIYVANAAANQPAKLAQILGLFFTPFIAVRAVTQ